MMEIISFYIKGHPDSMYIAELHGEEFTIYAMRDANRSNRDEGIWPQNDVLGLLGSGDWVFDSDLSNIEEFADDSDGIDELI